MMRRFLKWLFTTSCTLFCASTVLATTIPNNDNPTTFIGPTLQAGYAGWFTDTSAYSVLAEAGPKNYRAGATVGWKITDEQRLKISAEYLWQQITFSFVSGNKDEWVQQGAVGLDYQFAFYCAMNGPRFDLSAYYSHAPSKNMSTFHGFFRDDGIRTPLTNSQRIAGSNAAGVSPGLDFNFWLGAEAGIDLNYDNVRYDKNYAPYKHASGFGGTAHIQQAIGDNVTLGVSAAIRKPFNNYSANINWENLNYYGRWSLGLFGEYTAGKTTLPSTYNAGLSVNYFADSFACVAPPVNFKGDYKGDFKGEAIPVPVALDPNFLNWIRDPAVYMPQVLAIVDQQVRECPGGGVSFFGTIANQDPGLGIPLTPIDAATNFTGAGLTYSISITPALGGGDSITIDPASGVITGTPGLTVHDTPYTVIVTATNSCGSAQSNPIILTLSNGID